MNDLHSPAPLSLERLKGAGARLVFYVPFWIKGPVSTAQKTNRLRHSRQAVCRRGGEVEPRELGSASVHDDFRLDADAYRAPVFAVDLDRQGEFRQHFAGVAQIAVQQDRLGVLGRLEADLVVEQSFVAV